MNVMLKEPPHRVSQKTLDQGVTLEQALAIIRDERVGAGGVIERFRIAPDRTISDDRARHSEAQQGEWALSREVHETLTAYLASGLPVILAMDHPEAPRNGRVDQRTPHAVLVLGMHLIHDPEEALHAGLSDRIRKRREGTVQAFELPGRFVVHDLGDGPFTEVPALVLLDRAWKRWADGKRELAFLVVGPKEMRIGIQHLRNQVLDAVWQEEGDVWDSYLLSYKLPPWLRPREDEEPRLVVRLLRTAQLTGRYQLGPTREKMAEILRRSAHDPAGKARYWWTVEVRPGRLPEGQELPPCRPHGLLPPCLLYIWSTGDPEGSRARAVLRHLRGPEYRVTDRDGRTETHALKSSAP